MYENTKKAWNSRIKPKLYFFPDMFGNVSRNCYFRKIKINIHNYEKTNTLFIIGIVGRDDCC